MRIFVPVPLQEGKPPLDDHDLDNSGPTRTFILSRTVLTGASLHPEPRTQLLSKSHEPHAQSRSADGKAQSQPDLRRMGDRRITSVCFNRNLSCGGADEDDSRSHCGGSTRVPIHAVGV